MKDKEDNIIEERYSFASPNEPTQNTGAFHNESQFVFSILKDKKPTLLFRNGDFVNGHKIKLIELFPINFPFGWGGPDERRATKVSEQEVLRHYSQIALPQMQQAQFLLVLCSMYQRLLSFRQSYVMCRSNLSSSSLGEHIASLSQKQIELATDHVINGKEPKNVVLKRVFSSVKGHCSNIGHSNEAASSARFKMFSFWHYFGSPAIFFTITPCDECSFRVRLYATCKEHKIPNVEDIMNQSKCLVDFEARKCWRAKYPGACAIEYENIVQIVIKVLIGWNQSEQKGIGGIFGMPLAYADSCEEQARYTLHSHILVWIENFNNVRDLLFHEDESIKKSASQILQSYFENIAQASFGDLLISIKVLQQVNLYYTDLMMLWNHLKIKN